MRLRDALLGATLLSVAPAQQTSPKPTAEPDPRPSGSKDPPESSSTGPKTHTIDIGANGYSIEPNRTFAKIDDTIEWRFHSGEHWIIRGILDYPCIPREYIFEDWPGLSSGPMKVDEDSDEIPFFRTKMNSTHPILFYSGAEGACVDHKMMGVINPHRQVNLINYKAKAIEVEYQLRPGDPWPEDKERPSRTAPAIPTATSDAPEETPATPTNEADEEEDGGDGLGPGAIAGLGIGGTIAFIIFGLAVFYCRRRGGVKILFTNETPSSPPEGQYPRYSTPVAVQAPFRPPRTPHTENWRPTTDNQGTVISAVSPEMSMHQHSIPAISPYKTGEGAQGCMAVSAGTPPAGHEQRHIASYFDPNLRPPGSGRPLWSEVQYSRVSANPIELPALSNPSNSALPQHQAGGSRAKPEPRKFSWSGTGEDALFCPSRT